MGEFSILHWLVVLIVILIVFGPKRLPEIGEAVGKAIREFKKSVKDSPEDSKPAITNEDGKKSS